MGLAVSPRCPRSSHVSLQHLQPRRLLARRGWAGAQVRSSMARITKESGAGARQVGAGSYQIRNMRGPPQRSSARQIQLAVAIFSPMTAAKPRATCGGFVRGGGNFNHAPAVGRVNATGAAREVGVQRAQRLQARWSLICRRVKTSVWPALAGRIPAFEALRLQQVQPPHDCRVIWRRCQLSYKTTCQRLPIKRWQLWFLITLGQDFSRARAAGPTPPSAAPAASAPTGPASGWR